MKKILLPVLALGVVAAGLFAVNRVNAQTTTAPYDTLIQKIAKTFNLDESKVKAIFDEEHQARQTERKEKHKQMLEDKLSQAVKDGKLTEAQKNAIISKLTEFMDQAKPQDFKNMTPEQRKDAMQKKHDELKSWAQSQGIDPSYLMFGRMHRGDFFK